MTCSQLPISCLFSLHVSYIPWSFFLLWLVLDFCMICSWLVHNLYTICLWLVHELLTTCSWLVLYMCLIPSVAISLRLSIKAKFLDPWNFGSIKLCAQKILCAKKFCGKKKCWSKIILGPTNFLVQKILGPEKCCVRKLFDLKLLHPKYFGSKRISVWKNVVSKKFWVQKILTYLSLFICVLKMIGFLVKIQGARPHLADRTSSLVWNNLY